MRVDESAREFEAKRERELELPSFLIGLIFENTQTLGEYPRELVGLNGNESLREFKLDESA